jgi:hypothetical protein
LSSPTFIRTTYCAESGDSGSAVYRTTDAVGVHSGGSNVGCGGGNDWSVYSHVEYIQDVLGVSVVLMP